MITRRQVELIHAYLIDRFGGSPGIRDENLLESAVNAPFITFDGIDLYPSTIEFVKKLSKAS